MKNRRERLVGAPTMQRSWRRAVATLGATSILATTIIGTMPVGAAHAADASTEHEQMSLATAGGSSSTSAEESVQEQADSAIEDASATEESSETQEENTTAGPLSSSSVLSAFSLASPTVISAGNADIIAQLINVPATAHAGDTFTYTAKISNLGPDAADNSTFKLVFGDDTFKVAVTCDSAAGGATCPTDTAITNDGMTAPTATGTIATLPAGGSVSLSVTGRYPYKSSTGFELSVTPDASVSDTDPSTNVTSQQTSTPLDPSLKVTKVQHNDNTQLGQNRTYTVRYENTGNVNFHDLSIGEVWSSVYGADHVVTWSATCTVATTVSGGCPSVFDGTDHQVIIPENPIDTPSVALFGEALRLAPGEVLELNLTVREDGNPPSECGGPGMWRTRATSFVGASWGPTHEMAGIQGSIVYTPTPCVIPDLVVTQTQARSTFDSDTTQTYTMTVENRGTHPVNGIVVSDSMNMFATSNVGAQNVYFDGNWSWSISCIKASGGAACPTNMPSGVQMTRPVYILSSGMVKVDLPAGASLQFQLVVNIDSITCKIVDGDTNSISNEFYVSKDAESGPGAIYNQGIRVGKSVTSKMIAANTGRTKLSDCESSLKMRKTADKINAVSGDEVTYTLRFENELDRTVDHVSIRDVMQETERLKSTTWEASCTSNTRGVLCPFDLIASSGASGDHPTTLFDTGKDSATHVRNLSFTPGAVLEIKLKFKIGDISCGAKKSFHNRIYAEFNDRVSPVQEAGWSVIIPDIPCSVAPTSKLKVTKTQDKEVVASGKERIYTMTIENISSVPASYPVVADEYSWNSNELSELVYKTVCGPNTQGMDCPLHSPGVEIKERLERSGTKRFFLDLDGMDQDLIGEHIINIPAGAKLELKTTVTHTLLPCRSVSATDVFNRFYVYDRGGSDRAFANGRITCVDVSTATSASVNGVPQAPSASGRVDVQQGDRVTLNVDVTNAADVASNVPVSIDLPNMIEFDAATPIACVNDANSTCATNLTYDPVNRRVTGTIPEIKAGGKVTISFDAIADARGKQVLTFKAETTAPVEHDIIPETGTLNASSITFGYIPTVLPTPVVPTTPAATCMAGGAQWNVPANDAQMTWQMDANRHLIATAMPAYIFTMPDGSQSTTYDFGTPEDAGYVNCVPIPTTPTIADPCDAGNATWDVPADTALVTWTLRGDGHLIASTVAGKAFTDGTTSHDYGVAVETNTTACTTPVTPATPTTPGTTPTTPTTPGTPGTTPTLPVIPTTPSTPGVTPVAPTTPAPTEPSGNNTPDAGAATLARTGSDASTLLGGATLLGLVGLLTLRVARRR